MRIQVPTEPTEEMAAEIGAFISSKQWGPMGTTAALMYLIAAEQMAVGNMALSVKWRGASWLNFSVGATPLAPDTLADAG